MKRNLKKAIENFKNYKVLVVGDAILDLYINGTSDRLCREAPVPVINVRDTDHFCGGAANTAINLAALGAQTFFLTVIGKDDNGKELLKVLKNNNVSTDCVITDKDRRTLAKKRITVSSNILLRVDEGSTGKVSGQVEKQLHEKLKKIFRKVDAIILSDYGYGVITDSFIAELKKLKSVSSKIIVADSKNLEKFKVLSPTAVKPNYEETVNLLSLKRLHGIERISQIHQYGERLLEITGAECVTSTMDAEGTLVFQAGAEPHHIFTSPHDNKRAIGAGDTFISALCLAFCAGLKGAAAAEIASAAAAVVLQKDGTVVCSSNELKAFFNDNPKFLQSQTDLVEVVAKLKSEGKKIVFTNGCFDILHRGHILLLEKAKALGDILIVGINGDESIRRLKGVDRPINSLDDRISVMAGLQSVNYLVSFNSDTPEELLKIIKPDFFAKGGDYSVDTIPEADLVRQLGGTVKIIPFVDNRSTTLIIQKIKEKSVPGIKNINDDNRYAKASGME